MSQYFLAGNLWLLVTLTLVLGRQWERSDPDRYSFFGVGRWFSPGEYALMVLATLFVAALFFGMDGRARRALAVGRDL